MKHTILAALPFFGALVFAQHAQATETFSFWLNGDGNVSAHGTITIAPDSFGNSQWGTPGALNTVSPTPPMFQGAYDPLSAWSVTNVTGVFSDKELNIDNVAISGLFPNNYMPHFDSDPLIPHSFGWYLGIPGQLSYDNLYYPDGSPQTCLDTPFGGLIDNYGLMLTVNSGDTTYGVNLWSNGIVPMDSLLDSSLTSGIYGVGVSTDGGPADYFSGGGLTLSVPEPSTWAMMLLGFAGLGYAGLRRSSALRTA